MRDMDRTLAHQVSQVHCAGASAVWRHTLDMSSLRASLLLPLPLSRWFAVAADRSPAPQCPDTINHPLNYLAASIAAGADGAGTISCGRREPYLYTFHHRQRLQASVTESSVALPPEQERAMRHHRFFTLASGDRIVRPPDVIKCASNECAIKEANTATRAAETLGMTASLRGYF